MSKIKTSIVLFVLLAVFHIILAILGFVTPDWLFWGSLVGIPVLGGALFG